MIYGYSVICQEQIFEEDVGEAGLRNSRPYVYSDGAWYNMAIVAAGKAGACLDP